MAVDHSASITGSIAAPASVRCYMKPWTNRSPAERAGRMCSGLLWISGCVWFALMLGMAFTGYLLPWDQKAYFATTVGTNMATDVPFIGGWLKRFIRCGNEMGTLTVSRFFVAHVFLIPAAVIA